MRSTDQIVKREPQRHQAKENELFVSRRSAFGALLKRAQSLLDSNRFVHTYVLLLRRGLRPSAHALHCYLITIYSRGYSFPYITIHGLGAAVELAVRVALTLHDRANGGLLLSTTTSSVCIVDDLIPLQAVRAHLHTPCADMRPSR